MTGVPVCRVCGEPKATLHSLAHGDERCFDCAKVPKGEAAPIPEWAKSVPELFELRRCLMVDSDQAYKSLVRKFPGHPRAYYVGIQTGMKIVLALEEKIARELAKQKEAN